MILRSALRSVGIMAEESDGDEHPGNTTAVWRTEVIGSILICAAKHSSEMFLLR